MDHCNGFYFPEADAPPELMFILHHIKTIFANPKGGGVCRQGEPVAVEAGAQQRRNRASNFDQARKSGAAPCLVRRRLGWWTAPAPAHNMERLDSGVV
jgi:hypothetical protein